jgi:hypothetical protein
VVILRSSFILRLLASSPSVLAACSSVSSRQTLFVAATNETVTLESVIAQDGIRHLVYGTNRSTEPVVITSFELRDCANVRNRCELSRPNLTLGAGQRTLLATVEPLDRERAYEYRYDWSWHVLRGPQ